MSSIALFPCAFTPVDGIVGELSRLLELRVYGDDDLITYTATKFGTPPEKLKRMMYGGTSVFNQFTLEREIAINHFRSLLVGLLESPDRYLFNGFLASLIPARITHVLRVLVAENKQVRVAHAMKQGMSQREAKKAVRMNDISAYGWTDFLFRKEAYDKSLYDLVIPVAGRAQEALAAEIIGAYRKTSVLQTAESRQAVADMRLETEVERELLGGGHKVDVRASKGDIILVVSKTVLNFGKLGRELSSLAEKVAGVKNVEVKKSADYAESIYRKQKFELPSKVLFVDDEKEFVRTVSERLISRDVGTYGVYNGDDALELVAEDRPDVMVLDLKMPGMHGVEVLRRTKELAPEVEVIILTGHGSNVDMQECMALGAFAYMNKPVDIEELSATIKAANEEVQAKRV
jgi:CheY-like chemotaxis protein